MADKKFTVSLNVENIGPHSDDQKIVFSDKVDSNKAIFFATNGTGKSFISRAFRLCAPSVAGSLSDDVLTIGKDSGQMQFSIQTDNTTKDLRIDVHRGTAPTIQNNTGLLFHVFNNDYVEENIKQKNYTPDGQIEGYILGKVQIDLSEDKQREKELGIEVESDSKKIDEAIEKAKSDLHGEGITPQTNEFRRITRESVDKGFDFECDDSVEGIIQQLHTLEKVPEGIPSIGFTIPSFNLDFLQKISEILGTEYPKSEWDDDFVEEYKKHQAFIESGLAAEHSDTVCPFCKREYDENARMLISQYNAYRADKESQIMGMLSQLLKEIDSITSAIKSQDDQNKRALVQLTEIQKYFPSLQNSSIQQLSALDSYISPWMIISDMIEVKKQNLCRVPAGISDAISNCKSACEAVIKLQKVNADVVKQANSVKDNSKSERLTLRRKLCNAKALFLHAELQQSFESLRKKQSDLRKLHEEIEAKEQTAKVRKRDKVYETLETMLDNFFAGKYQIDKDTFQIKFRGSKLNGNASKVLSDGEKSIVAFCWYLAETHTLVEKETDYDNLFFVIDDPISSMDFHFVYVVAQILRSIKSIFGMSRHERLWVFTHNIEFFSIVARNHVLVATYMLKPGKIVPFNHQLLLPYENHLFDLLEIAERGKTPNHTTGNSIRHVIETISKFEDPEISIEKYVVNSPELQKDPCIFSLCQDLSHGTVRRELPYDEELLKAACKTVIAFVKAKYPKQVEKVRK